MTWMQFSGTLPLLEIVRAADGSTLDITIFIETIVYMAAVAVGTTSLIMHQRQTYVYSTFCVAWESPWFM